MTDMGKARFRHTEESKRKMSAKKRERDGQRPGEFAGKNNPMYGTKGDKAGNWKGGLESGTKGQSGKGNRSYKSGRYFENKARKELEKLGYYVTRSGASKGVWDLIAINNWQIRLIQIKKNQLPRPSERKQMEDFVCPKNATKECWRYYSKGRRTLKQIYLYPHTEDSVDFFAEG